MSRLGYFQSIGLIPFFCLFICLVQAADISTLQTALSLVREDMEKSKSQHDAKAQAVIQQQKIVAERKKQLSDESSQLEKMQKDAKQAWEQYVETKQKYEKAQADLDAAWGKK